MGRVRKTVQKADRNRFDLLCGEALGKWHQRRLVERDEYPAARVDALADRKAQPSRHQRRRQIDIYVVLLETVLVADFDRVAKALGRQQRGLGAFALDDRVGCQSCAVNDDRQIGWAETRLTQYPPHHLEDGALGGLRCRQYLGAQPPSGRFESHIRKRAADIDTQPRLTALSPHHVLGSDLAPEEPIDRQLSAAADYDRKADQQQVKRHFHAAVGPKPAYGHVNMESGDEHKTGEQCSDRPGQQAKDQADSAKELETADVIGPERRRVQSLLGKTLGRPRNIASPEAK